MTTPLSDADLLARLVAFDSVSRNGNLPIADFICDYLDKPGVRIERNPSPGGDKTNLAITMGPDSDENKRGGLVLSGHMDVVPADEDGWHSDPFTLTIVGETFVGRGACDMKGFLALAMNAAMTVDLQLLEHPLVLLFTYDEEVGTVGAKHFADSWSDTFMLPGSAIIGEPTSLKVVRLHKGHFQVRITLTGKGAHSGYPHLGLNAIEPAGRVIVALSELRHTLEQQRRPNSEYFPEVPYAALNVALISGGSAVNIVPDRCELDIGVRLLPGMDTAEVMGPLRQAVQEAVDGEPHTVELVNESPPLLVSEEADIYRDLCGKVQQRETHSASYATDAGWFQTLGLECVIFGPGSIEVAHKPNESMPMSDFVKAAELLGSVIHSFCLKN